MCLSWLPLWQTTAPPPWPTTISKRRSGDLLHPVERTEDISWHHRLPARPTCSQWFFHETRDLVENSSAKFAKKNLDMVVANNLKVAGAGFGVDTNVVTFITPDGTRELPDEQGRCGRCHSGRDPAAAGKKVILPGFCCTHITKSTKDLWFFPKIRPYLFILCCKNYIIRVCPHIWKESVCAAAVNIWRRALLCSCTRIIASICWTM